MEQAAKDGVEVNGGEVRKFHPGEKPAAAKPGQGPGCGNRPGGQAALPLLGPQRLSPSSRIAKGTASAGRSAQLGADDAGMQEALLIFYLQLFGDPTTMRLPAGAGTSALNSSNLMEKTRELFLLSRTQLGEDSPAVSDFLREFVQTQMFEW